MVLTWLIIGITVLTSIIAFPPNVPSIEALRNPRVLDNFIFNPYVTWRRKQWWRLFTAGLIHANWWHLLINMFVLYFFGRVIELYFVQLWGPGKGEFLFLFFYVASIGVANLPDLFRFKDQPYYNALGASGATSAMVFASILFDPWNKIYIFPIPIPIPAIVFGVIYLLYENYMARRGTDNIGHNAHFWGSIFGFVFPIILKPGLFMYFLSQLFKWA